MKGKSIYFDDKKINKSNFYRNKKLFNIDETVVGKILDSKRKSYGKKVHLNTLLDIMITIPLGLGCIKLPQIIGYIKHFDNNKTISLKATNT